MSATLPAPSLTRHHDLYLSSLPDAAGAVIVATGELDAASTVAFTAYTNAHLGPGRHATVDLSRLKFFAVEGFSAIQDIHAHCAQVGASWQLVAGPPVHRVLGLCEPQRRLRVRSLELVTKPRERTRQ